MGEFTLVTFTPVTVTLVTFSYSSLKPRKILPRVMERTEKKL